MVRSFPIGLALAPHLQGLYDNPHFPSSLSAWIETIVSGTALGWRAFSSLRHT